MANLFSAGTGFAGLFLSAILSSTGAPVTNTTVSIYQSDGSTVATDQLWVSTSGGSTPSRSKLYNPSSNSISTDGYGNLTFYADPGIYVLSFTVGGTPTTKTVMVSPDFTDAAWNDYEITANATILSGDCVFVDCSSGNITVTLTSPGLGCSYKVVRTDDNFSADGYTCTVEMTTGDILGPGCGSGVSSISLNSEGAFVEVIADGTNGHITAGVQDSGWLTVGGTGVAFQNSAANILNVAGARYRLVGNRLQIAGGVATGTNGVSCFTLPAGMRPQEQMVFVIQCNANETSGLPSGTWTSSYIYVTTSGAVIPATASNFWIDEISYLVD